MGIRLPLSDKKLTKNKVVNRRLLQCIREIERKNNHIAFKTHRPGLHTDDHKDEQLINETLNEIERPFDADTMSFMHQNQLKPNKIIIEHGFAGVTEIKQRVNEFN